MSSEPSIAVLIPAHNPGHWLKQAVSSALRQKLVTEVIVCDDGSTDGSLATLNDFNAGAITLLRQPQSGGNSARNALLAATRCDWVQFLDADDYLEPEKIARQLREAGSLSQHDVLYSPVWGETWTADRVTHRAVSPLDANLDLFTQWITWQLPQTGGALWRTTALRAIGGWNLAMPCCQEHELYLRALHAGLRWKHCPSPGAVYRLWSEQTVCRKDPVLVIKTRTALIDRMLAWLDQSGQFQPSHRAAAGQAFFEMARTWARYDQTAAGHYLRERQTTTEIRVAGPAAPFSYRAAYHLLGFSGAERLARLSRSRRQ